MAWLRRILDNFRSFNKQIGYPPSWGEGVSHYESPDGLLRSDSPPAAGVRETPPSAKEAGDPEQPQDLFILAGRRLEHDQPWRLVLSAQVDSNIDSRT